MHYNAGMFRLCRWVRSIWPVLLLMAGVTSGTAQTLPDTESATPWLFDGGSVTADARIGDVLYFGGSFTSVARPSDATGPFAAFAAADAGLVAASPDLTGAEQIVSDGTGGWFVADGRTLRRLDARGRHVPPVMAQPDGAVYSLARNGQTLYIAGAFTSVGSAFRARAAAFDIPSGRLLDWHPRVEGSYVSTIAISDGEVYLGGNFQHVSGQPRQGLARVDAISAAVAPWTASISGGVSPDVVTIAVTPTTVFIGGNFWRINTVYRATFAALDRQSGQLLPLTWSRAPDYYDSVRAIVATGSLVIIGGSFVAVSGDRQPYLVALNAHTGAVLPWRPLSLNRAGGGGVRALGLTGDALYVAGDFEVQQRLRHLVKIDLASGGVVPDWDPSPSNTVEAISVDGDHVGIAGRFQAYRARSQRGLAAFSVSTGALIPSPEIMGTVRALATMGTMLYAGGSFVSPFESGAPRALTAIDTATGAVRSLSSDASLTHVTALRASDVGLYVADWHRSTESTIRLLDADTGRAAVSFVPLEVQNASGLPVTDLEVAQSRLWGAGSFTLARSLGTGASGISRQGLVVADAITGEILNINPAPNSTENLSLASNGQHMFVGGAFSTISGQSRRGLARFHAGTGVLDEWSAGAVVGRGGVAIHGDLLVTLTSDDAPAVALHVDSGVPLGWMASPQIRNNRHLSLYHDLLVANSPSDWSMNQPSLFARRSPGAPAALSDFSVRTQGRQLSLRWTPSLLGAAPTAYRLLAGSAPGRSDLADILLPPGSSMVADAPARTYYLRLIPQAAGLAGPPTAEVRLFHGALGCAVPPVSPRLLLQPDSVAWHPVPHAIGYELRATRIAGDGQPFALALTASTTSVSTRGAPPGTYEVVLASVGMCGVSATSNPVMVTVVPPTPPARPQGLSSSETGRTVTLSWMASSSVVNRYIVEAGSATGLSDVLPSFDAGLATSLTVPSVPPGRYFVRVRAIVDGLPPSPPSSEVLVVVR